MLKKTKHTAKSLRARHPLFTYQSYSYQLIPVADHYDFRLSFTYTLENLPDFTHLITFHDVNPDHLKKQPVNLIDRLVLHIGLIEAFSYWKLAASPTFNIQCGNLCSEQISFWYDLLINGMGEYFYVNQLDFTTPNFLTFQVPLSAAPTALSATKSHSGRLSLVNLGGGKDSAVMLTLLHGAQENYHHLICAPHSPAADQQAKISGHPTHAFTRTFDPQLFQLNHDGYLNGHVPFSASLAFANLLAAVIFDADFCLVGNESSADENSLTWLDRPINHQFSKSTKFEQSFQTYCTNYLINNVKYFSFLRVFNEFQIAQLFCTNPLYWSVTRSCNRGQQAGVWCHQCAKCLFVYLLFAAFLDRETLITKIFDYDLFTDLNLASIFEELLGLRPTKPLECVGTRSECQAAFYLVYTKCIQSQQPLPPLIAAYADQILSLHSDWPICVHNLTTFWQSNHSLPSWAETITRSAQNELVK